LWTELRYPCSCHCMASVVEARKDPILRRYVLRRHPLQVGGLSLNLVTPDAKEWIHRGVWAEERIRGGEPPYWVQVWPAAVALARHLARSRPLRGPRGAGARATTAVAASALPMAGLRVLDLGCGLGVPGCTAAWLGASVTFADKCADALAFAAWNANALSGERHETRILDWSRDRLSNRFDLILLADVSYHASHHAPVLDHVARCLTEDGVVLHADPYRAASTRFLANLPRHLQVVVGESVVRGEEENTRVRLVGAGASTSAVARWTTAFVSAPSRTSLPVAATDPALPSPGPAFGTLQLDPIAAEAVLGPSESARCGGVVGSGRSENAHLPAPQSKTESEGEHLS